MRAVPLAIFVFALGLATVCHAATVRVAVASNFSGPMKKITQEFEASSPHKVVLTFGSSGKFYAQIRSGAPFDVFYSADEQKPTRLASDQLAEAKSQFCYAVGVLALWSAKRPQVELNERSLSNTTFSKLAIANPRLAPYGAAAVDVIKNLGLWERLQKSLVQGENITQTFQFVQSGNADLGFVALSQLHLQPEPSTDTYWIVPDSLHTPIRQDAILLKRGLDNPAAAALLEFTKSAKARSIIENFGYRTPGPH
ncbi:molybdate ABC transporter substrate-binding protein [Teredinibacter turnerae]|uniref:molybdate ABC transporter substrate-binding protein n=1 Tax=Teredinibacter turnerae TaxID=2426 RepID=UPI000402CF44|nr:molybdate ABC transporter substrate-binding protein [Teredinibacter turnerae]